MGSWKWDNKSIYVQLPFNDPINCHTDQNWKRIRKALTEFQTKLAQGDPYEKVTNVHIWLRDAVSKYNKRAKDDCNFGVISSWDIRWKLINALPTIIESALCLPMRIKRPLEILKKRKSMTVTYERDLICSLLAHAFLSTFPTQNIDLPSTNFWRLFHNSPDGKSSAKHEKLKCILEYFNQMGSSPIPNTKITFQRCCVSTPVTWEHSTKMLCELLVTVTGKIENATEMLQVDFANKFIGGGVLSGGAVQEEIRFAISPELIAARLFTEELTDDEVVVITGSRQFSSYAGYGSGFTFRELEPYRNLVKRPVDSSDRELSQVVAMDAMHFRRHVYHTQYTKANIDRELNKSYIGFSPAGAPPYIATGNWGCGAFGGDPELKFIIQWMAASQSDKNVLYHARDQRQQVELESMKNFLALKQVTLGTLYYILMKYLWDALKWTSYRGMTNVIKKKTVFQFMREHLS